MNKNMVPENHIIVFNDQKIRRIFHNEEWWFSIIDVINVLADTNNSRRYWSDLKRQLVETEDFNQLYEKIVQLKFIYQIAAKINSWNNETWMWKFFYFAIFLLLIVKGIDRFREINPKCSVFEMI